jgi:protein disulfide-isomerase A6
MVSCCRIAGCGHCKRLVPEYTKLGEAIAADPKLKNRVLIAKVDADAHRELGEAGAGKAAVVLGQQVPGCVSDSTSIHAPGVPPDSARSCCHSFAGEKFGVRGFPTIKWFPRGKPNDPEE